MGGTTIPGGLGGVAPTGALTCADYCRPVEPERTILVRSAALVGAVAAGVRLVWVVFASRQPLGLADPVIYLDSGASIASGDGYTSLLGLPTAYYPPGYPYFVGLVQRSSDVVGLGDHVVLVIGLAQALLGGVAAAALVVAGAHLSEGRRGLRIGVIAGLVLALWPNLVLHAPLVLSETLFMAAFCVLLAAVVSLWTVAGRSWIVTAVISAAVCTWVRPQAVLVVLPVILVAGALARRGWRDSLRLAAWPLLGILLAVVPWTIRNAIVMDAFVPMSTNTGDNLCIGFHDGADGGFSISEECATDGRYVDGPEIEVARDAELRNRTVEWIGANPSRVPGLSLSKLGATFVHDTDGIAAWESYGADRHLSDTSRAALEWLSDLYYWAAGLAALVGVAVVARAGRHTADAWAFIALVGLSQALVPVLFFGDQRFKIPVIPSIVLLAALAVDQAWDRRRTTIRADDQAVLA